MAHQTDDHSVGPSFVVCVRSVTKATMTDGNQVDGLRDAHFGIATTLDTEVAP